MIDWIIMIGLFVMILMSVDMVDWLCDWVQGRFDD